MFAYETEAAGSSVTALLDWNWDMENTCGPRPQGPAYPMPPVDSNGTYIEPLECDIIQDTNYLFDYKCTSKCQMDPAKTVTLKCNCFFQVGPVNQVVPCKWEFEHSEKCPEVPLEEQFDWECDPREGHQCKPGQYPGMELIADNETDAVTPEDNSVLNTTLAVEDLGGISNQLLLALTQGLSNNQNGSQNPNQIPQTSNPLLSSLLAGMLPMQQPAMPFQAQQPFIFSPTFTQSVGDVSAANDHEHGHRSDSDLSTNHAFKARV